MVTYCVLVKKGTGRCFSEDGNVLCFIKSGNVLCFRAASMHELKEMAAEITSIIEEPLTVTDSVSQVTSDVSSQFVSDVDCEVAASDVAVSEVAATDVASNVTSALAAREAPA